jgi:hypothetical protein
MERETGFEPATLCLGSMLVTTILGFRDYLRPKSPEIPKLFPFVGRSWLCLVKRVQGGPSPSRLHGSQGQDP